MGAEGSTLGDFNLLPNDQLPTQVNISDVTGTELDYVAQGQKIATGAAQSGWWNRFWAACWAGIADGGSYVVSLFAETVDEIMAGIAVFFEKAQGEKNPAFYDLAAKILQDLTGVKVDAAALKSSALGSGRIAGMETFGGDLYNILLQEFAPTANGPVVADTAPAKRFLGFLLNWSIREGNVAVLSEMLPESVDFAKGFRHYGTGMAHNLGLGRMARRAFQPLIQHLVSDPLTYAINAQYSPKRLNEQQVIHGYFRQVFDLTRLRKELAEAGYSSELQDFIIDDARPLTAERELVQLLFRGGLGDPDFTKLMQARGYDANEQFLLTQAQRPVLEKTEITALFAHGAIDQTTAIGYLAKLGYDQQTASLVLQAHGFGHAHVPVLHFGELKRLMAENQIDVLEFQDRLRAQGFSNEDVTLLTVDALTPKAGKEHVPSLAVMKAAYKAGNLIATAALTEIERLGYSKDDAAFILNTWPKPGATKPTTPTGSATG